MTYSCDYCGIEVEKGYQMRLNGKSICSWSCPKIVSYVNPGIETGGGVAWDKDFLPYYDETLKITITSPHHRDKEFRKAGLYVSQDDKKMLKRWADTRKYKEEMFQEQMKKEGKTYKIGSGKAWSDKHQDFVHPKYLNS